jgi:WD40 repeat protein
MVPFLVFVLALVLLPVGAAFSQEKKVGGICGKVPGGRWQTLEGENFLVHFTGGSQKLATRVANIAEEVHAKLTRKMEWKPSSRTHIVLLDWHDRMNAWASPLPRNNIRIYPVGPGLSELELTFTDDYLRMLITHEYVHTLCLDMASGVPAFLRKVFGRSMATVPTAYLPLWMHEGYAVYNETVQTRGGRIRGPYFDMVLRCAVLDGKFNTISQAQAGIDSWPVSTEYIYGGMFCKYLAGRFGEERLPGIFRRQSSHMGPFVPWLPGEFEMFIIALYWFAFDPVGGKGMQVFGRPYETLWAEWRATLEARYKKQKAEAEKKGLTVVKRLTDTGYRTVEPRFSPDGKHIAYVSRGGDRNAQLRLMDSDGLNDRLLYQGAVESLSWSPDGKKIVFAMLDYWRGLYLYSDLYIYELESGRLRRLTYGLRARTPAWSPDGKKILFAVNTGRGNSDLAVLDLEKAENQVTYLGQPEDFSFYSGCAWSPDGKKIAFVRLAPGSLQRIYTADPDGSDMQAVTDGRTQDLTPSWSRDGKYLLFTSGRTGIYNIFARSFESGQTVQLTNVLGGALSPSLSPDGRTLTCAAYSADGWDIHTGRVELDKAPAAEPAKATLVELKYDERARSYEIKGYNALRTLFPTLWAPFFYSTGEYGAMVAGADILEKHLYTLQLGYNSYIEQPVMRLLYSFEGSKYRGWPLSLNLEAYRLPVLFPELMEDAAGEDVDYWEDQGVVDLSLGATVWRSTETEVKVSLGYEYKGFERLSHLEPGGTVPGTGRLSSAYLAGLFDNSRLYKMGISPADGRNVELTAKSAGSLLGSDYRVNSFRLNWSEYLSLPWARHHVLMARVAGGMSDGEVIDKRSFFQAGGSQAWLPNADSETFPLRGYETNDFQGMRAAVATLEYRFPLWLIESGPATEPIFFRKLSGYLFVDSGNAWSGPMYLREFKTGAGAGVRLATDLFYQRLGGYALDVGFAHGFSRDGISQFYFTVTLLW